MNLDIWKAIIGGAFTIALVINAILLITDREEAFRTGLQEGHERGARSAMVINDTMKEMGVCKWADAVKAHPTCTP